MVSTTQHVHDGPGSLDCDPVSLLKQPHHSRQRIRRLGIRCPGAFVLHRRRGPRVKGHRALPYHAAPDLPRADVRPGQRLALLCQYAHCLARLLAGVCGDAARALVRNIKNFITPPPSLRVRTVDSTYGQDFICNYFICNYFIDMRGHSSYYSFTENNVYRIKQWRE
jgi:hypothetical protein